MVVIPFNEDSSSLLNLIVALLVCEESRLTFRSSR
jgi:hypothetical protein